MDISFRNSYTDQANTFKHLHKHTLKGCFELHHFLLELVDAQMQEGSTVVKYPGLTHRRRSECEHGLKQLAVVPSASGTVCVLVLGDLWGLSVFAGSLLLTSIQFNACSLFSCPCLFLLPKLPPSADLPLQVLAHRIRSVTLSFAELVPGPCWCIFCMSLQFKLEATCDFICLYLNLHH